MAEPAATSRRAFVDELDRRVRAAAARPGATLESVSSRARGAFPALVADRLRRIGPPPGQGLRRAGARPVVPPSVSPPGPIAVPAGDDLPGPELHGAEFEWYFTRDCARDLVGLLRPPAGGLLLLGAPTVASAARSSGIEAALVDRSPFLEARFGRRLRDWTARDLRRPLGMLGTHRTVFFDAPWHEDHMQRWLWNAALAVAPGGTIGFALFGELTRRAAAAERERLLARASAIGSVSLVRDALAYRTPRFERHALAAAGLDLAGPWRRGDLVLVTGAKRRELPTPLPPREEPWRTWTVGTEVVKARADMGGTPLPGRVARAVEGAARTLDTVSRSRIRALGIDVWTSRNAATALEGRGFVADEGHAGRRPAARGRRTDRRLATRSLAA